MDNLRPRERLLVLREEAVVRLAELGVSRDDIVQAAQGANVDDEHDPEGTTIAFERELLQALIAQTKTRLTAIDGALERIAAGNYGSCEICSEPIAADRLAAHPTASRCLRHA